MVLCMVGTLYTEQQLSRELARRGMTHKLGDVWAMERDPLQRTEFAALLNALPITHFVSIDESEPPRSPPPTSAPCPGGLLASDARCCL